MGARYISLQRPPRLVKQYAYAHASAELAVLRDILPGYRVGIRFLVSCGSATAEVTGHSDRFPTRMQLSKAVLKNCNRVPNQCHMQRFECIQLRKITGTK